jgi:hypothetical protein
MQSLASEKHKGSKEYISRDIVSSAQQSEKSIRTVTKIFLNTNHGWFELYSNGGQLRPC